MAEEFQAAVCGEGWWNSQRAAITGNFGGCWRRGMKAKSSDESSDGSMIFQDIQKPGGGATTMSPDSAFQMMGIHRSPPTTTGYWDQSLLVANGRSEGNYNQSLPQILNNFPATGEDSSDQLGFVMDQQNPLNFITSSGDCTSSLDTCTTFPISYPPSLLQTLFDSNSPPPPPPPPPLLYDFRTNRNELNSIHQSLQKQHVHGGFHLANKAPFWDASVSASNDHRTSVFLSTPSQFRSSTYEEKPNCSNITIKSHQEEIRDSGSSVKKSSGEATFKRPRLETPSPLPTFKVRKEKLGDRITALQQLVSPFGKTDTASVLHEAIEYIKLLHDQVNVLSTPYIKNGATMPRQQIHDKIKEVKEAKRDLRSLGLCLVPVSSTFPVVTDTTPEFWTPNFGGSFR